MVNWFYCFQDGRNTMAEAQRGGRELLTSQQTESRERQREEGARINVHPSKPSSSDPRPLARTHLLMAHSAMNSLLN
jgi:hypothetical protein